MRYWINVKKLFPFIESYVGMGNKRFFDFSEVFRIIVIMIIKKVSKNDFINHEGFGNLLVEKSDLFGELSDTPKYLLVSNGEYLFFEDEKDLADCFYNNCAICLLSLADIKHELKAFWLSLKIGLV
jgi:hypothetical protein